MGATAIGLVTAAGVAFLGPTGGLGAAALSALGHVPLAAKVGAGLGAIVVGSRGGYIAPTAPTQGGRIAQQLLNYGLTAGIGVVMGGGAGYLLSAGLRLVGL